MPHVKATRFHVRMTICCNPYLTTVGTVSGSCSKARTLRVLDGMGRRSLCGFPQWWFPLG